MLVSRHKIICKILKNSSNREPLCLCMGVLKNRQVSILALRATIALPTELVLMAHLDFL